MYGFGDDAQPYAESVELLEDLVLQYITDMVGRAKFDLECFIFRVSPDAQSRRHWQQQARPHRGERHSVSPTARHAKIRACQRTSVHERRIEASTKGVRRTSERF